MKLKIFFALIIILSACLRIYRLGDFPASLYGDEQAFAYNAYSILMTGKDEFGIPFPLQFRSFDDYKAPIPVYLLVPFIKLFGLENAAIRLPIALFSVLTVLVSFFLIRLFFHKKISLLATFLFAVSPWHVHLSRGYFESTLGLFFFVSGIYFFLKNRKLSIRIFSMVFFAASVYSYFTPRILVPLFLIFLFAYDYFRNKKPVPSKWWKVQVISLAFLILLSLPLVTATFFGEGLSRYKKLSGSMENLVTETVNRERTASNMPFLLRRLVHNKFVVKTRIIKDNYLEHLSPNFWYIYGDNSLRYFTGNMGMFYLFEFPFMIIGFFNLWKEKKQTALFFTAWLLLAPIPAALVGRSFAVRSLAMLPAPFIFVSYGIIKVINFLRNIRWRLISISVLTITVFISLGTILLRYYLEYPVYAATWWGWENKKAIDYATEKKAGKDFIFLSDFYTGLPLALAYYNKILPEEYRQAVSNPVFFADSRKMIRFGKFFIGSLDIDERRYKQGLLPPHSLYLGRPEEYEAGSSITAPDDGRVIFRVYDTP